MWGTTVLVRCETWERADGTRITALAVIVIERAPLPIEARGEIETIDVAPVRESAPVLVLRRAA
jgi:hypothetical protein